MNVTISVSVASIDEAEQLLRNLRSGLGSAPLALTVEAAPPAPAKAPRKSKAAAAPAPAPAAEVDELGIAVDEYARSNGDGDDLDLTDDAPAAPAKAAPAKPAAVRVTPETIKLRVRELVEAGEMARVQAAFAKVGAKKLSEIPEAKLGAVLALLQD